MSWFVLVMALWIAGLLACWTWLDSTLDKDEEQAAIFRRLTRTGSGRADERSRRRSSIERK